MKQNERCLKIEFVGDSCFLVTSAKRLLSVFTYVNNASSNKIFYIRM